MWSQVKVQPQMSLNPYISVQIAGGGTNLRSALKKVAAKRKYRKNYHEANREVNSSQVLLYKR